MSVEKKIKSLNILSFALAFLSLVIIKLSLPVAHYEVSIYTPIALFWIFAVSGSIIAIINIYYQAFSKNYRFFWTSFSGLILNVLLILLLPIFRGYYIYGGNDPHAHLEMSISIISNGNFGQTNFYPVFHILAAICSELCSLKPETVTKFVPVVFSISFILFTYFFTFYASLNKKCAVLSSAASTTFLFSYYHITMYPQILALFLFPLIFYLYFRSANSRVPEWKILLLILLILMPFTHAIASILIILCLASIGLLKGILQEPHKSRKHLEIYPALLSFVTFSFWYMNFSAFGKVASIYNWLISEAKNVPRTDEIVPVFAMGLAEWITLSLKMYGHQMIYLFFSIIALILIGMAFVKRREFSNNLMMVSLFLVSSISYLFLFVSMGATTFGRLLSGNMGLWITPALVGFTLFSFLERNRKLATVLLIILIFGFMLSASSIYRSEWILQPNWHFTYNDAKGIDWLNNHMQNGMSYTPMAMPIGNIKSGGWKWANVQFIPPHLGYDKNSSLGASFTKDTIMAVGEYRQILISQEPMFRKSPLMGVWGMPQISKEDIKQLHIDNSINMIYSNGDVDNFFVKASEAIA